MNINSLSAIEEDVNFYDALRQRSDLNFGRNMNPLYHNKKLSRISEKLSRF